VISNFAENSNVGRRNVRPHRAIVVALLATVVMSCGSGHSEIDDLVVGCYDVEETPAPPKNATTLPPLRLTDEAVEYREKYWHIVTSLDSKRPLAIHSLWRWGENVLILAFESSNGDGMSDSSGAHASLKKTINGFRGSMVTVTPYDVTTTLNLVRRSCATGQRTLSTDVATASACHDPGGFCVSWLCTVKTPGR
jgi:hypothetical protein